ncbi:MAG TPA: RluA family pseudouridine synthase [Clostridiaceae bacterium]|nr:RluA family pseudouridine synthase [Clostridiaceae bacterium]
MTKIIYLNQEYNIPVVYEDNHLIIVEKPVGLLSQEDQSGDPDLLNIIKEYLRVKYNKPGAAWLGLVHRLDRPVGGLMAFAKTSKAASRLSAQIRERQFVRKYAAVIHGQPDPKNAVWSDYISLDRVRGKYIVTNQPSKSYRKKYQKCELSYQLQKHLPKIDISLVEIDLKTGRSHQIRSQMRAHNHPLVGDRLYGKITDLDRNADGPALYAIFLQFKHPTKDEICIFKSQPKHNPFDLFY